MGAVSDEDSVKSDITFFREQRAAGRGNRKLDGEAVREIKRLLASGESVRKVRERFGISETATYEIKRGIRWAHITID